MSALHIRRVILVVCLILMVFSLLLALFYTPPDAPARQGNPAAAPYTLKTHEGFIAIFEGDAAAPSRITGIRVELLPLQDQMDLAEGIPLSSREELDALLEDYGS